MGFELTTPVLATCVLPLDHKGLAIEIEQPSLGVDIGCAARCCSANLDVAFQSVALQLHHFQGCAGLRDFVLKEFARIKQIFTRAFFEQLETE